jgi:Subtilase family
MRLTGPRKLSRWLALAPLVLVSFGASAGGEFDRWKHPQPRDGARQFHPFSGNARELATERGPGGSPNAVELNSRPANLGLTGERREGAPAEGRPLAAEGRPLELNRQVERNPLERGPELQRLENPQGRGNELERLETNTRGNEPQRQTGPLGPNGQRELNGLNGQNGQNRQRGLFSHQALAAHTPGTPGAGNRGLPQRFAARPNFGGQNLGGANIAMIPRRPLIGERGFTGVPPAGETRFLTNEMVFHVPPNVTQQQVDAAARKLGLSTVASQSFSLSGGTLFRFRINDGRPVGDVIHALEQENLGVAQPNYVFRLQQQDQALAGQRGTRADPAQYVVDKLRLVDVHRLAIGGDIKVAVIDSEIDAKNPELAGAVVEEFDAVGNHDKPHMHGTGMAGAIAAHRRLIGVAPGVHILAIHAFSSSGESAQATSEHILRGIDWAIQKGAKIINMSFAGPDDPMMQLALQKAHEKGVILIAAAGNMGPKSPPLYPGADPNVIAVTATDAKDQLLPQANQGAYIAVAAPGVDILEPAPNNAYQVTSGTSVAAAHVSGIAALLLDRDPTLDDAAIRDILTSTARHHTPNGRDDQFGWGIVDPYQALTSLDAKVAHDRSRDTTTDGKGTPRPVTVR